jgi:hypothetical protein
MSSDQPVRAIHAVQATQSLMKRIDHASGPLAQLITKSKKIDRPHGYDRSRRSRHTGDLLHRLNKAAITAKNTDSVREGQLTEEHLSTIRRPVDHVRRAHPQPDVERIPNRIAPKQ